MDDRARLPSHTRSITPYGEIDFADGVQTWINPRLDPSRSSHDSKEAGVTTPPRTRRVKSRARTAMLEIEVVKLQRLNERLSLKNAALKAKLALARRKVAPS